MQGLVNFAAAIGYAIAIFLPVFCYLAAGGLFIFAGWGFWLQARPDNPFRGRPWVPLVSLILCGVFASFDVILTKANVSLGSNVTVGLSTVLTSYAPPVVGGDLLGATPGATVINVVELFQWFFRPFGAMACFFAVMAWRGVVNGRSNRSQGGCLVQFFFGILLINILSVATWLVAIFQT